MFDGEERPPRSALGALLTFGAGVLAGGIVCGVVLALPRPVRKAERTAETLTPPVVRVPVDGTDVRVTVDHRRVRVENVSRGQTGRLRLEFRARHRVPADCGDCVWPRGLPPGGTLTVTLRGEDGPVRVRAVTEVPDRAPADNEARAR
ncbi:hypothetical protein [Actinocorallia herbida]|uniref:hypothetical protein n=1 Tax=Actinocorallia herbida TaxID=58109 RepID=UPI000F4C9F0F|nr:hypothetical protein [Actinocorallia herbida]